MNPSQPWAALSGCQVGNKAARRRQARANTLADQALKRPDMRSYQQGSKQERRIEGKTGQILWLTAGRKISLAHKVRVVWKA